MPAACRWSSSALGEGGHAAQGRADRLRRGDLGRGEGRPQLERGGDPPGRARRSPTHGGIAVLRGNLAPDGAVLKPSAASAHLMRAPRAGGGLRGHRRLQGEDRGRGPRHRRDLRDGAEELRAARLSGHGRGRQHGAAAEGAAQGDHRHGADLGRAHVGHGLRDGGAAHRRPRRRAAGRWRWCGTAT